MQPGNYIWLLYTKKTKYLMTYVIHPLIFLILFYMLYRITILLCDKPFQAIQWVTSPIDTDLFANPFDQPRLLHFCNTVITYLVKIMIFSIGL